MNDTCLGYIRSRNRTCGNPSPAFGGLKCLKFNGERDMFENENLFIKPKQQCGKNTLFIQILAWR